MFQKKKGFTLIELLAVIVILAVIALIATPLIMNVINDARKNSFKDSAYGITKAVELRVMQEMQNPDGPNPPYKVDVTGTAIDYSGDRPTEGWAYIDANGNIKLYMKNSAYCAYKEANAQEITLSTTPGDCDAEINTISNSSANTLEESTGPVVPPTPGYSYVENTDENETYRGILYLDPTDLSTECDAEAAANNKQGVASSGTSTLTETKSGCMKWFAFGDDGNGKPTNAILDHNTTAVVKYDFDNKNDFDSTRTHDQYEADWQLAQDIANWDSSLSARFPSVSDMLIAGGITDWSEDSSTYHHFGGGDSDTQDGRYWWLYTNLAGATNYHGKDSDWSTYNYYDSADGTIKQFFAYAYWLSDSKKGRTDCNWVGDHSGYIYFFSANSVNPGVRPVISLSNLNLNN